MPFLVEGETTLYPGTSTHSTSATKDGEQKAWSIHLSAGSVNHILSVEECKPAKEITSQISPV